MVKTLLSMGIVKIDQFQCQNKTRATIASNIQWVDKQMRDAEAGLQSQVEFTAALSSRAPKAFC